MSPPRPNQYSGTCFGCRTHVSAGLGFIIRNAADTAWNILCINCIAPSGAQRPPHEEQPTEAKASKPPQDGPSKSGDLNRLIKLMKMTTSATDGEALAAIRRANEWLSRNSCDWETMLLSKVTVMSDPFAEIAAPPPAVKQQAPSPKNTPTRPYTTPPRPQPTPRPQTRPPQPSPYDPFGSDNTIGGVDISKPFNPRSSAAQRRQQASAAQQARTFTADFTSSTPSRKSAPDASEL